MFEAFNINANNCVVESRESSNAIPYSLCKKLNAKPYKCFTQIVQLDKSNVKVLWEINDVLRRLASNSVDLPESSGLLLNRDWSQNTSGYF